MSASRYTRTATYKPMTPDVPQVTAAMGRSNQLASLMQRLQMSQACLEAVRVLLPRAMAPYVKAGPVDDEGWTLLAANAAVSAKLRQLQTRLIEVLAKKGLKVNAIRVRVQTGR